MDYEQNTEVTGILRVSVIMTLP